MMIRVSRVEALAPYVLRAVFSDGCIGEIDLSEVIEREGSMVRPLRDLSFFARVSLDHGVPTWPNGYDIATNWLYVEMGTAGTLSPSVAA